LGQIARSVWKHARYDGGASYLSLGVPSDFDAFDLGTNFCEVPELARDTWWGSACGSKKPAQVIGLESGQSRTSIGTGACAGHIRLWDRMIRQRGSPVIVGISIAQEGKDSDKRCYHLGVR
jgi:hypothetical protein